MIKKLIKHGNSSALIIDKPVIELLGIEKDTLLDIFTDGKNIIISPVKTKQHASKVKKSLLKINKKHSKTLNKLSE
ncbi:MAG: AbrB family transcriptional regulator [Desulfuromonas sp. SDB]|nr:MAG: AbrB family transcriptional regulator [Desulfuromonas sp. SDB]